MPAAEVPEISGNWKKLKSDEVCTKLTACINCRLRKKRCHLDKPSCSNCISHGLDCRYGPRPADYAIKSRLSPYPQKSSVIVKVSEKSRPRKEPKDIRRQLKRSAAAMSQDETQIRRTLQKNFDVSATDISAAYGNAQQMPQQDYINGGLHDTHRAGRYLALDCEMVGTGPPPHSDDLLARVSLVNFHGQQIYDSYVLPVPGCRVEDYRTHVSGIRPEHLRPGIARPFADVRRDVHALLNGAILVGHALRKDLAALQLDHPKRDIRDTSRHAAYRVESRGKTPALRNLAKSQLGLTIQTGEHSSIEDARTTMMLFKKEKSAFELENRRQYGTQRVLKPPTGKVAEKDDASDDDPEDEYDSDDDAALLDEEEDISVEGVETTSKTGHAKKKKKKKKRTKR